MIVLGPRNRVGPQGDPGKPGKQGKIGPAPEHEWQGTKLRFQNSDGSWGDFVDLKGPKGKEGKQGDPGKRGGSGSIFGSNTNESTIDFLTKKTDIVPANSSKVIDTIPLSSFRLIEYTLSTFNMTESKTKGLKMLVKYSETSLNDQVYGKIGDQISFNIDAVQSGLNMNLTLQNNESFPLNLTLIRAQL